MTTKRQQLRDAFPELARLVAYGRLPADAARKLGLDPNAFDRLRCVEKSRWEETLAAAVRELFGQDQSPYLFHRKPEGAEGDCPVCGCPGHELGEHRTVAEGGLEGTELAGARWVARVKAGSSWKYSRVKTDQQRQREQARKQETEAKQASKHRRKVIRAQTRQNIAKATRMIAEGKTVAAVAAELGVAQRTVHEWRERHTKTWNRDFRLAMQDVVSRVRREAGTEHVVARPDEYMRLATLADKWTAEQNRELFPQSDVDLSLTGFFRTYYLPVKLGGADPATVRMYERVLKGWARITGDPPLRLITPAVLAKYRDVSRQLMGRGGKIASPNTVRSKMTHIQAILDAAGPKGPRRRYAAGILAEVPFVQPPRAVFEVKSIVGLESLGKAYGAAGQMADPDLYGIAPADWWRGLLVMAFNTALRFGGLFKLRWEYVDLELRWLRMNPAAMKSRNGQLIPLNEIAVEHLQRIRQSEDPMVFPLPYTVEWFRKRLHDLQDLAGIPEGEHFTLQTIRRTAATLLWQNSPEAAVFVLGHKSELTTTTHYVQAQTVAAPAIANMPQPEAFRRA